jgi:hypothetical protein
MSKLFGPDFIALQVRDLEISKLFYIQHLRLSLADQSPPGAVVFKTSPIPFAIRTAAIDLSASPQLGWGVAIWLACKDADFFTKVFKRLPCPSSHRSMTDRLADFLPLKIPTDIRLPFTLNQLMPLGKQRGAGLGTGQLVGHPKGVATQRHHD